MPFMIMRHEVDPAQAIWDKIGDISQADVFNTDILVATYMRPQVTMGGIHLTDKYVDEDKYQSKVGLILKMGPKAFIDRKEIWFRDEYDEQIPFAEGEWVVFRPSDGWALSVNDVNCRMLVDTNIRMRIPHPDMVW
jgi:hypothetical protein